MDLNKARKLVECYRDFEAFKWLSTHYKRSGERQEWRKLYSWFYSGCGFHILHPDEFTKQKGVLGAFAGEGALVLTKPYDENHRAYFVFTGSEEFYFDVSDPDNLYFRLSQIVVFGRGLSLAVVYKSESESNGSVVFNWELDYSYIEKAVRFTKDFSTPPNQDPVRKSNRKSKKAPKHYAKFNDWRHSRSLRGVR